MSLIVHGSRLQVGEREDGDDDYGDNYDEAMKSMAVVIGLWRRLDTTMEAECGFSLLSNALGAFTFYTGFEKTKPPTVGTVRLYDTGQCSLNLLRISSKPWLTW
jgi:hypothetical protein